jgi:hypothetical protein
MVKRPSQTTNQFANLTVDELRHAFIKVLKDPQEKGKDFYATTDRAGTTRDHPLSGS